jgi:hypothetical protein
MSAEVYAKGDRVRLSPHGRASFLRMAKRHPDRVGTVVRLTRDGNPVIHWDGGRAPDNNGTAPVFIERADERDEMGNRTGNGDDEGGARHAD